jgi:CRP-like cAMP-binding protein
MVLADAQALLAASIARFADLTEDELQRFVSAFTPARFPKKASCLRTYMIDANGKEVTLSFAPEGWWAADLASFTQRMPSRFHIEALEHTDVLAIGHNAKEELFASVPRLERVFRLLVQRRLAALQDRFVQVLSSSAEVCYNDFLVKYPMLHGRIPQTVIATYVGITPEFLSKLRARAVGKGRA